MTDISLRFDRLFRWLELHRFQFSLSHETRPQDRLLLLKPLGELALVLDVLIKLGIEPEKCLTHCSWIWSEIREGNELIELISARYDMVLLCGLYANLKGLGFSNNRLDLLLEYVARTATSGALEMHFWQRLARDRDYSRLGLIDFPAMPLKGSWLGEMPEPWTICNETTYAVTHEVFHVTDFGDKKSRLSNDIITCLRRWIPTWSVIYQIQKNYDILAELIMTAECIGGVPWFSDPMQDLLLAQGNDDYVPSPPNSGLPFLKPGQSPERVKFLSNYHTTLVSVLAIAMRIHSNADLYTKQRTISAI